MTFKIPNIRPRGFRAPVPSGHIIGRVSPGLGDAEFIPLDQLAASLNQTGLTAPGPVAGGGTVSAPQVGVCFPGFAGLNKSRYIPLAKLHKAVMMPAAAPADLVTCRVAPTTTVNFTIVNDPTTFEVARLAGYLGTITILAGQTTGSVVWTSSPTLLPIGSVLYLYTDPANGVDSSIAVDTTFIALEILLTTDLA